MSDTPPADIAKLKQYIESKGIPCEYNNPTNVGSSFDYLELTITEDVDEIRVDMDSDITIWANNCYVELDRSKLPTSFSSVRMSNMVDWGSKTGYTTTLIFQFEPSYYKEY
jgi:hypothetical protein